jgi:thymidylate synthase (FAD)
MKLIESSVEIIPQEEGLLGAYKQIEKAGRVCYKSEDRICEGSAKKMVDFLISRGHLSPLEHGTIYLHFKYNSPINDINYLKYTKIERFYRNNPYSRVVNITEDHFNHDVYITTNARVITEHNRQDDLQYWCEPTEYHIKRYTARFICSRSVSHELVRHRAMSFCQTSQRYVNYSLGKFNSEIQFVVPEWVKNRTFEVAKCINPLTKTSNSYILDEPTLIDTIRIHMLALDRAVCCWYENLKRSEEDYMYLLIDECGLKPQEARSVLPNDTQTEVIVTGYNDDDGWKNFFNLRRSTTAHPDIRILADDLHKQFIEKGIIK